MVEQLALSITKAAEAVGVSKSLLYREIDEGRGPRTVLIGTVQRVLVSDLQTWLESRAGLPKPSKPKLKSNDHALPPPPCSALALNGAHA